jgi:hypothetical protein
MKCSGKAEPFRTSGGEAAIERPHINGKAAIERI